MFASSLHAPSRWQGVISRYAEFLPVSDSTPIVSLCEGNTPLVPAHNFAEAVGAKCKLYLKYEGLNPTASFKDRGMTVAISKACEKGAQAVVCASTGNTSASAAAYAARAKLKCFVVLPHGNIAMGKLSQALIYGAQTIAVDGNFDAALRLVRELAASAPVEIVNSVNPVRIQGQKTAAFEICDQLGRAPDFHFLPVGNAGNITASFKDRGMTVAISKACEKGAQAVVCASTGNTSASAAAYAARAKLKCFVVLPHGNIAMGKLSQALIYGAQTIAVDGNFDAALRLVRELAASAPVEIVNSVNPVRIQGQKTAAFEICDQLGRAPDFHFLPVGNAGNITAYWQGFQEYFCHRRTKQKPQMCGFQAAGAAPIVDGHPVEKPETVATAIQIGNPASWNGAVRAAQESGGFIAKVADEEILHAYRKIAQTDGVFVEPACAAPLAGFIQSVRNAHIPEGSLVTATMTGHGLKDPDRALAVSGKEPEVVPPNASALMKALGI